MKKVRIILIIISLLAVHLCSLVNAYEQPRELMMRRCARGMVNMLCAPVDILNYMEDTRVKEGVFSGMTYGAFKGTTEAVARAAYGAYEVATFFRYADQDRFEPTYDAPVIDLS